MAAVTFEKTARYTRCIVVLMGILVKNLTENGHLLRLKTFLVYLDAPEVQLEPFSDHRQRHDSGIVFSLQWVIIGAFRWKCQNSNVNTQLTSDKNVCALFCAPTCNKYSYTYNANLKTNKKTTIKSVKLFFTWTLAVTHSLWNSFQLQPLISKWLNEVNNKKWMKTTP